MNSFKRLMIALALMTIPAPPTLAATLLSEGFEYGFPGTLWTVGDGNVSDGFVYWNDVSSAFGGEGTHGGSWKAYCAGSPYTEETVVANPTYSNNMWATMSTPLNLTSYTNVVLTFWYKMPSNKGAGAYVSILNPRRDILWSTTNVQTSWTQISISLNALSGSSFGLEFEFLTPVGIDIAEGCYLDDILVTGDTIISNDFCAGAIALADNVPYAMNTAPATSTGDPVPICSPAASNGVWFTYTPPKRQDVIVNTCGSTYDTVLQVYTGSCANLASVSCNDDDGLGCAGSKASAWVQANTSVVYRILAAGYNGATGQLHIVVQPDRTPPIITCPANITTETTAGTCQRVVNFSLPPPTDNLDPAPNVTYNPTNGASFSKGTTTVTCVAADISGNTSTCQFKVVVRDLTPPVVVCSPNLVLLANPGHSYRTNVTFSATASDNCSTSSIVATCTPPSGSTFNVGVTPVTCKAVDSSSNTGTCSFTVTILAGLTKDCNANGIEDLIDIANGTSRDCDGNDVPDECQPDADSDGVPDPCDRCPGMPDDAGPGIAKPMSPAFKLPEHAPDLAANSKYKEWLAVWRETRMVGIGPVEDILIRLINPELNYFYSVPRELEINLRKVSGPRAGYEPISNEWWVAWSGENANEKSGVAVYIARLKANGEVLGEQIVSQGWGTDPSVSPTNVCIAAGQYMILPGPFFRPYILIVWEDVENGDETASRCIFARRAAPDGASGIVFLDANPFIIDDEVNWPEPLQRHVSRNPCIDQNPNAANHHVAFEVEYGGTGSGVQHDICLAQVGYNVINPSARVRWMQRMAADVTTSRHEQSPSIAWNAHDQRGIITFNVGTWLYGQLFDLVGSELTYEPVGDSFGILPWSFGASVDTPHGGEGFLMAVSSAAGVVGKRTVGQHVLPLFDSVGSIDTPALASDAVDGDCYMLLYRDVNEPFGELMGRPHCGYCQLTNHPPEAVASAEASVCENTMAELFGEFSHDPDGDSLRYRWRQTAGRTATFLTSTNVMNPAILMPDLPDGAPSETLTFQLEVDDFRSNPAFLATNTVSIQLFSGTGSDELEAAADSNPASPVGETDVVTLDAAGTYYSVGQPSFLRYTWALESCPSVAVSNEICQQLKTQVFNSPFFNIAIPRFSAAGGLDLQFRLRVSVWQDCLADDDVLVLHVNDSINEWPTAVATEPLTAVQEGSTVQLTGSGSSDPNGDPLTFAWEVVSGLGPKGTIQWITSQTAENPQVKFSVISNTTVTLKLTVSDGRGGSGVAWVDIKVTAMPLNVQHVTPEWGAPGDVITIEGNGLLSVNYVRFSGPDGLARPLPGGSDSSIKVQIPWGDRVKTGTIAVPRLGNMDVYEHPAALTGPVHVQNMEGDSSLALPEFKVIHVKLHPTEPLRLTQGMDGGWLVRGKKTMLQAVVRTAPPAGSVLLAPLRSASCRVRPWFPGYEGKGFVREAVSVPAKALGASANMNQASEGINFYFDTGELMESEYFKFNISISNGACEVLYLEPNNFYDYPPWPGRFMKTASPRLLVMPVINWPGGVPSMDSSTFLRRLESSIRDYERIYPIDRCDYLIGPGYTPDYLDENGYISFYDWTGEFSAGGAWSMGHMLHEAAMKLYYWNCYDGDPFRKLPKEKQYDRIVSAISPDMISGSIDGYGCCSQGMIDDIIDCNCGSCCGGGKSIWDLRSWDDVVDYVKEEVWCDAIESLANFFIFLHDFIDGGGYAGHVALFSLSDNGGGALLAHELGHTMDLVHPCAWNHDGDNPTHCKYNDQGDGRSFWDSGACWPVFDLTYPTVKLEDRPHSLMSYYTTVNGNCFLPPYSYNNLRDSWFVREDQQTSKTSAGQVRPSRIEKDDGAIPKDSPVYEQMLELGGVLSWTNGTIRVMTTRPMPPSAYESPSPEQSELNLSFHDGTGNIISAHNMGYRAMIGNPPEATRDEVVLTPIALFEAVHPLPSDAAYAIIRYRGNVAWSNNVSLHSPSVTITDPTGAEVIQLGDVLTVEWSGSDVDGDELTYYVQYSWDGGTNYQELVTAVTNTSYLWRPDYAPDSSNTLIKVIASDGFHTGEAVSGPFTIAPKPYPTAILYPSNFARLPVSRTTVFIGDQYDLDTGPPDDAPTFEWHSSIDGFLGNGSTLYARNLSAGAHTITLHGSFGLNSTHSIMLTIVPDRDGDGIPDEIEEPEPTLDPDNPLDPFLDEDEDGITHGAEVLDYGTNPFKPDTDGDEMGDEFEIRNGFNPLVDDAGGDADQDGLPNGEEEDRGTNPHNPDTDEDGSSDGDEVKAGTDPKNAESIFAIRSIWPSASNSVLLKWTLGSGVQHRLTWTPSAFLPYTNLLRTNLHGAASGTNEMPVAVTNPVQGYYRIELE